MPKMEIFYSNSPQYMEFDGSEMETTQEVKPMPKSRTEAE
jgi:hypothetical protein